MSLSIREASTADGGRWDDFVHKLPTGTFCHLFAWAQVISETFGHRPYYLLAERDGQIEGVLPLAAQMLDQPARSTDTN